MLGKPHVIYAVCQSAQRDTAKNTAKSSRNSIYLNPMQRAKFNMADNRAQWRTCLPTSYIACNLQHTVAFVAREAVKHYQ